MNYAFASAAVPAASGAAPATGASRPALRRGRNSVNAIPAVTTSRPSTIVAPVLDVFRLKGWQAASMADLAEAADVQRGSLYHAYGGKEPLFLLAFGIYADRFLAETRKALDAPDARTALLRFFEVAIANMTIGQPSRGCLTTRTATALDAAGPEIRGRLAGLIGDLRQLVGEALAAPSMRAALVLGPAETADLLITFARGLAVMERIEGDAGRLRAMAQALTRTLVRS